MQGIESAPVCYGYGRHSTNKQEYTKKAQWLKCRRHWRRHLKKKGVLWGGFFYDKAVQGSTAFSERPEGRKVYAMLRPGDHLVVSRLDRPFRSVYDGAKVIETFRTRKVRFHSLDLKIDTGTLIGKFFVTILLAVAELERGLASERTQEVLAYRRKRGLPTSAHPPMGWMTVGRRARDSKTFRSTRRYVIDDDERELCEEICRRRHEGESIERTAVWLMTQREFPNKRRLDNYRAVEWAIAAKEMGYPRDALSGRELVKEWRRLVNAAAD